MRSIRIVLFLIPIFAQGLQAQGNPRDFHRPGPARERELYYAQVRTEINNMLVRWREAWEADDAGKLARFYVEGASYFPLNAPVAQSRPVIENHFADFLRTVGTVTTNMADFGMSGDLAYITCKVVYHHYDVKPERKVARTDLIILRRQRNGDWLIEAQMTQSDPDEKSVP